MYLVIGNQAIRVQVPPVRVQKRRLRVFFTIPQTRPLSLDVVSHRPRLRSQILLLKICVTSQNQTPILERYRLITHLSQKKALQIYC